jgi:RNA polymerase sigma factor (sigma-70 family)
MDSESLNQRLSGIQTLWTLIRQAHAGPADEVRIAREKLLARYGSAVKRYLAGTVRDPSAAEDLFQEFAVRLIKGDLHGADPERGRFRQFVKGVLFHLVADHHRKEKRRPALLGDNTPEPAVDPPSQEDMDREFVQSWREDVLARAWARLEQIQRETGKLHYTVLRFRSEHPEMSSGAMAEQLGKQLGKTLSAAGVRQTLHRAREEFAELIYDEVVNSLESPTVQQLEDELTELGLIEYCRPVLEKRTEQGERGV